MYASTTDNKSDVVDASVSSTYNIHHVFKNVVSRTDM
jgi:hypothetical protein